MKIRRIAILVLVASAAVSCGDDNANSGKTTTPASTAAPSTTAPDPKDAVRAQIDSLVDQYVNSLTSQMPDVTAKVQADEVLKCVKERTKQAIDNAVKPEGQPEGEFIGGLLTQIQTGLFSIVGLCSQPAG